MTRIEICGGIASGKTSLAKLLEEKNIGTVIYENFQTNPFWKAFYEDQGKYIFETELTFTLQHYHEIKQQQDQQLIICDYSLLLDLAYANIGLTGIKLQIYKDTLRELHTEISTANLLIYLECSSSEELKRIKSRNRDVESSIEVDFLEKLNTELFKDITSTNKLNILKINSEEYDFVNNEEHKRIVISKINSLLNNISSLK